MKTISERMTSQKKIILDYLRSVKTHPNAETVYKEAKKKLPSISRGTVYRILSNLKEKKEIQIIEAKNTAHFDADTSDHSHFICSECNRVYDVCCKCLKCGVLKKKKTKVGKINSFKIYFYGICEKCMLKK